VPDTVIATRDVSVRFGGLVAVDHVTLDIAERELQLRPVDTLAK